MGRFDRIAFILFAALLLSSSAGAAFAQVIKSQEQALKEAFAAADTVLRHTLFLDAEQLEKVQANSRSKFDSRVITYYVGKQNGQVVGYAFFEKEIVRTKETIVMVRVTPDGAIAQVEALAFMEPMDYMPAPRWFGLFDTRRLTPDLWPSKEIHMITGATLSVRAFTMCARRALATYQLIGERSK